MRLFYSFVEIDLNYEMAAYFSGLMKCWRVYTVKGRAWGLYVYR
jgi:hypothetical protein